MSPWFGEEFEAAMGRHGHDDAAAAAAVTGLLQEEHPDATVTKAAVQKWRGGGGVKKSNQKAVAAYMETTVGELQRMLRTMYRPGQQDADIMDGLKRLERAIAHLNGKFLDQDAEVRQLRKELTDLHKVLQATSQEIVEVEKSTGASGQKRPQPPITLRRSK